MSTKPSVVVVAGPTASGKTVLAASLAKVLKTEVVSFDARQFYKELDIGVARPTAEEMQGVPHHFIATHSIHHPLTAAEFGRQALPLIESILRQKSLVVLVGGAGFYLDALLHPLDPIPEPSPEARELARSMTLAQLQAYVQKKDPDYFQLVDPMNPARLARAVEVMETTGKLFSEFLTGRNYKKFPFRYWVLMPAVEPTELRMRIERRTRLMWQRGLVDECRRLMPFRHLPLLRTVGYSESFAFLEGSLTEEETLKAIMQNTWQYARRQRTWFRNKTKAIPVPPDDVERLAIQVLTGNLTG
ncbi:MAG: tRNA (adenosine(37)-N6)-dimethylallyltransferase MiaA [Flavobacteriales bacterium]|nr:tRNA (adenosine(37)-N6)-dimethylallyltransferase MiaA [Flavobacteriales bacterium]MCX7768785.1 tRNA (adenosine(37)-N6)-dimethylallyltransferase MiaA [Flavobacteriales bacterium]MDW8409421.1 tRNA (adenosine(37)-N6)-dimethylallyltransferase MiaA [Flavobacteriales bacterium]